MNALKRVIIVNDHTLVRQGLRSVINSLPGYQVVAEAGDGLAAVNLVKEEKPDLALMDFSTAKTSGFEATREIKALNPEAKFFMLTVHTDEEHVMEAFNAGAVSAWLVTRFSFKRLKPSELARNLHSRKSICAQIMNCSQSQ